MRKKEKERVREDRVWQRGSVWRIGEVKTKTKKRLSIEWNSAYQQQFCDNPALLQCQEPPLSMPLLSVCSSTNHCYRGPTPYPSMCLTVPQNTQGIGHLNGVVHPLFLPETSSPGGTDLSSPPSQFAHECNPQAVALFPQRDRMYRLYVWPCEPYEPCWSDYFSSPDNHWIIWTRHWNLLMLPVLRDQEQ